MNPRENRLRTGRRVHRGNGAALPWVLIVPALIGALPPPAASGQPFGQGGDFDPGVPTPESFLGYELGERFTPHSVMASYMRALSEASDRVVVETYGESYEGRPLLLLTITDPSHQRERERLRSDYTRLSDPRRLSFAEAETLAADLPLAVWLSFNVHGNEASSSEAAMAVAYTLAASRDQETRVLLDSLLILLDPCLNPDGRDRYVNWYRSVAGQDADPLPASREHQEPWPGGRYNHYLFDLNRDWAWLTQTESRARARVYLTWRPQVHVDFHEMWPEATYFFFPPVAPVHPLYPPQVKEWAEIFGRGNAKAFDARGWRYYTRESFDLYYPGYGDSWPTFQGAIGMTYEQAGGGGAGTSFARSDGDTLTLTERAERHYVAAVATLRTAAAHRHQRLLDFYRFFAEDDNDGPGAYLFPPGDDPPRTAELISLLMAHGIEVYRSTEPLRPGGLHPYDGKEAPSSLPIGTYVVPSAQPLHRFLHAVLEPEAAPPDTFFYDVSAWSLPFTFGIDAYWSRAKVERGLERIDTPPRVRGVVTNPKAGYAFLISWKQNGAALALARLQKRGVQVHFTTRQLTTEGTTFPPGSLIAFRTGNPSDLSRRLEEVAEISGVDVLGVGSGLTGEGPDLGSSRILQVNVPRVAIVTDRPASPTSAGACWFLLDRRFEVPHSLIRLEDITKEALRHFSVLVFPDDGWGGRNWASRVDSSVVETIREWVSQGGVYVGLGGGAFFAGAGVSGLSTVKEAPGPDSGDKLSEEERKAQKKARRLETQYERERRSRLERVPGTIFRVRVDPLHPLGFGYTEEARVLKISGRALELGPPGTNVATFTDLPKVSGYASPQNIEHFVDRPFLVDEPQGRGHVVMYVEDPNFRLFWSGLTRLFLNSIYFLPSLGE